jgi:hypothetical protein
MLSNGNSKGADVTEDTIKTIKTMLVSALFLDNLAVVLGFLTLQQS